MLKFPLQIRQMWELCVWLSILAIFLVRDITKAFRPTGTLESLLIVNSLDQLFATAVYNVFFHPLRDIPGPFWARATGVPSWYYATTGKRHIWLWQQFQIYGDRIRPEPNTVLFRNPEAYADIYSLKANVRRSPFYTALRRKLHEGNTLNTVDIAEHALKRKLLSLAFTEKSLRSATTFIIKHVDRWNQIMMDELDGSTEWSAPMDFSRRLDALTFDIMGDLAFGRSFDIKEPGDNPLKTVPENVAGYMKFYYPLCRSPFLHFLLWIKPRGLDRLFDIIAPPSVQKVSQFTTETLAERIALHKEQAEKPEVEQRQDIFYFLREARHPDTGLPAYNEFDLKSEAGLMIVAGSDTTSISLSGVFFGLTGDPSRCQKLVDEIRATFATPGDIVYGPKLLTCKYLRACIDEGMRLTPSGPCDLPREVLPGGIRIHGTYYPEGTIVATVPWVMTRDETIYDDPGQYRPERWMEDPSVGVSKEAVARLKQYFHPFAAGPGACLGRHVAMAEMMITVARTLHRFDIRRAPGSTLGAGRPSLGWGERDPRQMVLYDAFISLREGPEVQFRKRL